MPNSDNRKKEARPKAHYPLKRKRPQEEKMASVLDVAQYILEELGKTSTWKLQKLVYYSQAWHLVWKDKALFDDRIEAWANGPVTSTLYEVHKGFFAIKDIDGGKSTRLKPTEKMVIDTVIKFYKKYNGQQLSDLTHSEDPWMKARKGLGARDRCQREITQESMAEYYGGL